jgi:hypothetical protein
VPLVAALAIAAVVAIVYVTLPGEDARSGSSVVEDERVDVGSRSLRTYAVTYRDESRVGDDVSTSTSKTVVRRPFDARVNANVTTFTRTSINDAAFWLPPGPPDADRRPEAVLREAVRDGRAEVREVRRVARRLCRVYRIGASSSAPSLPELEDADEPTDVCIDAAGLILEEVTYDGEDVVRRRVATSVDTSPRIADDTFDVRKPKGDPKQVGSVQELEDDSRLPGGTFWQLDEPPDGFEFGGRYAVVPAGQPGFTDPTARGSIITFVSEVWQDGEDILVIDQGATQSAEPFTDDPDARTVRAGALGKGELLYSLFASEVRFRTKGTRFVIVRGTLAPSRLLEIAERLEGVAEGPLRVKE